MPLQDTNSPRKRERPVRRKTFASNDAEAYTPKRRGRPLKNKVPAGDDTTATLPTARTTTRAAAKDVAHVRTAKQKADARTEQQTDSTNSDASYDQGSDQGSEVLTSIGGKVMANKLKIAANGDPGNVRIERTIRTEHSRSNEEPAKIKLLEPLGVADIWHSILTNERPSRNDRPGRLTEENVIRIDQCRAELLEYLQNSGRTPGIELESQYPPAVELCKALNNVRVKEGEADNALADDFYGLELWRMMELVHQALTWYDSMAEPKKLGIITMVQEVLLSLTALLRRFRKQKLSPTNILLKENVSWTRNVGSSFENVAKALGTHVQQVNAVRQRVQMDAEWREHMERKKRVEEEQDQVESYETLHRINTDSDSEEVSLRHRSPPHDQSIRVNRVNRDADIMQWTPEMDDELLQALSRDRKMSVSERYYKCLSWPRLQELGVEHIQRRALQLRPTLLRWHEDHDKAVPEWVRSIEEMRSVA